MDGHGRPADCDPGLPPPPTRFPHATGKTLSSLNKSNKLARFGGPAFTLVLMAGAAYLLYRSLKDVELWKLWRELHQFPPASIGAALGLTALSYLALGDTHGFRDVEPDARVPTVYPGTPETTTDVGQLFASTCGFCHSNGGRSAGKGIAHSGWCARWPS